MIVRLLVRRGGNLDQLRRFVIVSGKMVVHSISPIRFQREQ
jgi:hypothetical protein